MPYTTQMIEWGPSKFAVTSDGDAILYGKTSDDSEPLIHIYTHQGELKQCFNILSCDHGPDSTHDLQEVKVQGQRYLAVSCCASVCRSITLYRLEDHATTRSLPGCVVYSDTRQGQPAPGTMCLGPAGSLYSVHMKRGSKSVYIFNTTDPNFKIEGTIPLNIDIPQSICYIEHNGVDSMLILCSSREKAICAIRIRTGQVIWKVQGQVEGQKIKPQVICTDWDQRLFVGDGKNKRILILHVLDGRHMATVEVPEIDRLLEIGWCPVGSHLTVWHKQTNNSNYIVSHYY